MINGEPAFDCVGCGRIFRYGKGDRQCAVCKAPFCQSCAENMIEDLDGELTCPDPDECKERIGYYPEPHGMLKEKK